MLRTVSVLSVLAIGANAFAGPFSIVPGGQDPESPDAEYANKSVDLWADIDYSYELDSAVLRREHYGDPDVDATDGIPARRDLEFKQFRHVLTPRLQVGIFRDTFITAALPIVIQQVRELRFVDANRLSSPTVADGLLPMEGFDARDPGTPTAGDLAFRGPNRHGIDQVHLGLGTALMNQQKDDTKPTWKIGAEIRLAIGSIMKFDPMAPSANKGVSRGVQEVKVWTSFARKLGWAEPWVELWWLVPIAEKSDALYTDPGFGATNTQPSQQAGVSSGIELYALDNRADQTRISIDLGSKVTSHFEGREYTEMWEVFALAGDSRRMGPLILDSDPTNGSADPLSHPGISNIENYLELAGQFAVRAQIGPHVRFSVAANLIWKTDHAISFADAGVDNEDDNDLVNPGTDEVNPLHSQAIDLVGNRYRTDEGFDVVVGVSGQVLF